MWAAVATVLVFGVARANYPVFEASHRMRLLLLPADMRVGSVIYRLRASDRDIDYPLRFDVVDAVGRAIIRIDSLPCTATHTYCQGNVYLTRRLEPDRVYDMILSVRDSTGQETKVDATIKATRATSHFEDVFPYVPSLLMVPEDTGLGATLGFVLARKAAATYDRPAEIPRTARRTTELEMWGSENFRLYQTAGTRDLVNASIKLTAELDFEERTMYMLTIFALDPWTVEREDTRNIAGFQLPVVVTDVQDMPPVFTGLPPVTTLAADLKIGDKILQVHAQDGDRGDARQVRYGLVSEKNPFTTFFNISEKTGEIVLAKPLKELRMISRANQPIILTVMAEEVKLDIHEPPALMATSTLALILSDQIVNSPPKFMNNEYVARLKENAPQGTALVFGASYSAVVEDLDAGPDGVFALGLSRDNGTFEASPSVAETRAHFVIRVRNNELLDFEKRSSVSFQLVASELGPGSAGGNTTCAVTVYVEDENDNAPVFKQTRYQTQLPENVTADTLVSQVLATDLDTGLFGRVAYTRILGYLNQSLTIDSVTGVILIATNNHGFDREAAPEYKFTVEAADMDGTGNKATVPLVIKILDVNDETPEFERQVFEFILQPGLRNFTSRAFVKAVDKDAEPPNNIVRYEIMSGNIDNKFHLHEVTGELTIRGRLGVKRNSNLAKVPHSSESTRKEGQWEEIQKTSGKEESITNEEWAEERLKVSRKTRQVRNSQLKATTKRSDEWSEEQQKGAAIGRGQRQRQDDYFFEDDEFSSRTTDDVLDSVIVLNVRAYDLGIPHRWQRAHVRIYPPESRARTMTFIVPGSRPDARNTEELLRTLTGGRVTVQDIKPYTGREQGTDLTSQDSQQDKSVVTATVIYESNSVVDLQQLEKRLTANKTQAMVEQSVLEYKSENRVLFWLLIFLLILVTIAALLLLLCCLWQGCIVCPCLEVHRRKVVISPTENVRFITKERGTETKGVQAVYSARREAWSSRPEDRHHHNTIHNSRVMERHEDSPYTPAARYKHPAMLVEDVEGQAWEHANKQRREHHYRHEYEDRHRRKRSAGTPRFTRSAGKRSPPLDSFKDRSPARETDRHLMRHDDLMRVTEALMDRDSHYADRQRDAIKYQNHADAPQSLVHITDRQNDVSDSIHYNNTTTIDRRHDVGNTDQHRGVTNHHDEAGSRDHERRSPKKTMREAATSDYDDEIIYREGEIDKPMEDPDDEGRTHTILMGDVQPLPLSPNAEMLHPDSDSLRRHEMERGSLARDWENGEEDVIDREQLYIKDGNAEILRLLTRGPRDDRPHTLVQESGKEILMQRFINDQAEGEPDGVLREYLTQEYLARLLHPHVVLQDTQSLPGHMESSTQTECEAATQTDEPALLLPDQRNARSDNELSDDEDKPGRWRRGRRLNIKTPIMEEGESLVSGESGHTHKDTRPAMFPLPESASASATVPTYTENKSSLLRRRKLKEKDEDSSGEEGDSSGPGRPSRVRDRRRQSNTVQIRADSLNRLYRALKDLQRAGEINDLTHSEDEPDRGYLKKAGFYRKIKELSTPGTTTGSSVKGEDGPSEEPKPNPSQQQKKSKYMDWYKNLSTSKPKKPARRKEDDIDSGIALSSLLGSKRSKIEKKSVFTIAYDDVLTKNIRPDTDSSQKL